MATTKPAGAPNPVLNFAIGGVSGMFATSVIMPMDYIKVHRQIMGETGVGKVTAVEFAKTTLKNKGPLEFYKGLSSALLRQAVYTTTRLGIYRTLTDIDKQKTGSESISLTKKFAFSLFAGAVGSTIGNPADVALVRIQTDALSPPERRRNYKGVGDALFRMAKEEGILTYWRGCTPTILRACSLNVGMLVTYDTAKEWFDLNLGPSTMNRISGSFVAALIACCMSLPFDNIKTKYQRMTTGADGKLPYSGFSDCVKKSIAREGLGGLYIGFPVYLMRVAPHVIITLLVQDLLHHLITSTPSSSIQPKSNGGTSLK
jgi:solute carrier family 25 oxoglutarate transporter 11